METPSFRKGIIFALSAYIVWGFLPLYWRALDAIPSIHILSFRIILSLFFVSFVLFILKNTSWVMVLKDRRKALILLLGSFAISFNWGVYIYAVNSGQTIEASLGYYINPLVSIILGLCFFREKLKPIQILAFALAAIGVIVLTVFTGRLPWVSLALGVSFGVYGMLKKKIKLSSLESLAVETLIAAPFGFFLLFTYFDPQSSVGFSSIQGLEYFLHLPFFTLFLLFFCGAVTSIPLFMFSQGAKMLPLSTLGFCQFITPTMAFITGLLIFGEYFPPRNFIAFGFIWAAVIVYIISLNMKTKSVA